MGAGRTAEAPPTNAAVGTVSEPPPPPPRSSSLRPRRSLRTSARAAAASLAAASRGNAAAPLAARAAAPAAAAASPPPPQFEDKSAGMSRAGPANPQDAQMQPQDQRLDGKCAGVGMTAAAKRGAPQVATPAGAVNAAANIGKEEAVAVAVAVAGRAAEVGDGARGSQSVAHAAAKSFVDVADAVVPVGRADGGGRRSAAGTAVKGGKKPQPSKGRARALKAKKKAAGSAGAGAVAVSSAGVGAGVSRGAGGPAGGISRPRARMQKLVIKIGKVGDQSYVVGSGGGGDGGSGDGDGDGVAGSGPDGDVKDAKHAALPFKKRGRKQRMLCEDVGLGGQSGSASATETRAGDVDTGGERYEEGAVAVDGAKDGMAVDCRGTSAEADRVLTGMEDAGGLRPAKVERVRVQRAEELVFHETRTVGERPVMTSNAVEFNGTSSGYVVIPGGTATVWGSAGAVDEFFVVQKGSVVLATKVRQDSLSPGDMLVIPVGTQYQFTNIGEDDCVLCWFVPSVRSSA